MRSRNEHYDLRWGDISLLTMHEGMEYLQYSERMTKTRTGETRGPNSARKFPPKAFENKENHNVCPVNAYKIYRECRPDSMKTVDSKFYLSMIQNPKTDIWFKSCPMGINRVGDLMKTMATKGQLTGRKVNHSGRKTCVTGLLHAGVHPTMIQQLAGHKNSESINHYATASLQQQENMVKTLSSSITNSGRQQTVTPQAIGMNSPATLVTAQSNIASAIPGLPRGFMGLRGNTIMGENFYFNFLNKRPRVIDSDSD